MIGVGFGLLIFILIFVKNFFVEFRIFVKVYFFSLDIRELFNFKRYEWFNIRFLEVIRNFK